jgi:uncharacterized membrane protein YqgA involved in biofilm formation
MIPTVLLLGLIVGSLLAQAANRRRRSMIVAAAVLAAVAWGVLVGIGARSLTTFAGGFILASANLALGAVVGGGINAAVRWLRRRGRGAPAQV